MINLKKKVEMCLRDFPDTRDCDAVLTFRVIYQFHNSHIKNIDGKWWVSTEILKEVKEDVCKRYRASFQANGLFLPTNQQVLKLRGLKQEKFHQEFSPSSPSRG